MDTHTVAFDETSSTRAPAATGPTADVVSAIPPGAGASAQLTTLAQIVDTAYPDDVGWRDLVPGDGEGYTLRGDLDAGAPTDVSLRIAAFVQMTDLHVIDDQSPLRVEFLDRYKQAFDDGYDTDSAYRPHEFLSTHIVDAMARAIRNIGRGPMTNLPLAFTVVTGDAVDNCQFNETRWYIDLLDGGRPIVPDSGQIGHDQSVSTHLLALHDTAYWSPEPTTPGPDGVKDVYRRVGYDQVSGLIAAARRPYTSTGLGMPWYAAFGNHDIEVQGNLPVSPSWESTWVFPDPRPIAVSDQKSFASYTQLPPNAGPLDYGDVLNNLITVKVVADPRRRLLEQKPFIAEHFTTAGMPVGHGFASPDGPPYYAIPSERWELVQYLVLDTTDNEGDPGGRINGDQFDWLRDQLVANSSRYIDEDGHVVSHGGGDKLIVIFGHHTIATIDNDTGIDPFSTYYYGSDLLKLLLRFPNVVAYVNGHTHTNAITPHDRGGLGGIAGGFWEISTASHIDWPSQSRIVELAVGGPVDRRTVSIFTTMVDIDAPLPPRRSPTTTYDIGSPKALAGLARLLAVNDPIERFRVRRGDHDDRNTQLLLPAPFLIADPSIADGPVFFAAQGTGFLWRLDRNGTSKVPGNGLGVAPGTSPAAALDHQGNLRVVWQASGNGWLWWLDGGAFGSYPKGLGLAAGTSPTIAAPVDVPGWRVAFHADNSGLWMVDETGVAIDTQMSMRAGGSPAIAASPLGGWLATWVDDSGFLCQLDQSGAFRRSGNGLGVQDGTDPSIAAAPGGGYLIAFHAQDGTLWTVTDGGTQTPTGAGLAAGASPSIAAGPRGYVVAFAGPDGLLWRMPPDGGWLRADGDLGVAAGSDPSVYPHPQGVGYEIVFHGADGYLWKVDFNGHAAYLGNRLGVAPGTNPATPYTIGSGLVTPPANTTVPVVVGAEQSVATSALYAAGLTPFIKLVEDCNHLQHVTKATPDAGTVVAQGTTVTLYVGATPKQVDPKSTRECN